MHLNIEIKMKLYSFLISFAFVNVSSITNEMDYIKEVVITNAHIELAYNMNNIAIKDKVVLNGLEHVIKKTIANKQNLLEEINNLFAVPEFPTFCHDWSALTEFQKNLQDVIQLELNIPVPQVPDINFRRLVLKDLGVKRREFTRIALKNILNRIINYKKRENVSHLINVRRQLGTNTLKNKISRALAEPENEISLRSMCHLIALFMSTKYPESHIKYIQINSDCTCTLKDDYCNRGSAYKTYGQIEGQWCQVIGNEVQPLKELLC
ncbi:uncharacterized protein LOC126835194 isoform X5 [Adelges cooleyi]|uniref:uncharacterized protein LOC126835194 isoform X5 n=1 Tax=Adelges cooleyi TaxID=133065 RepID=UPI00217F5F94|nr:uncharacterized protein LOC126835194 isoform X5 [Adelges cooleyi]